MRPEIALLTAIDRYLENLGRQHAGVQKTRARLAEMMIVGDADAMSEAAAPRCGHLDTAMALACQQGAGDLMEALAACDLPWRSYDAYPAAEIGRHFPARHAFASLAWLFEGGWSNDFDLGFFLIAPNTLYRDHHHQASELYVPLTGPTKWRFGINRPWISRQAHDPVWNMPDMVHATLVEEVPFLCLYAWTENIDWPAIVDRADDWGEIEARFA